MKNARFYLLALSLALSLSAMPALAAEAEAVVADEAAGLQWAGDPGKEVAWKKARKRCEDLILEGFTDWQLPTLTQLMGLAGKDAATPLGGLRPASGRAWSGEKSKEVVTKEVVDFGTTRGGTTQEYKEIEEVPVYLDFTSRQRGHEEKAHALCVRAAG